MKHFYAFFFIVLLAAFSVSCQYDYSSPLPGTIELRLKTISHNIDFAPLNNFTLKVTQINVVRAGGSQLVVNEDVNAISRTANIYNTLDFRARDSSLVIGQAYAPPDGYTEVLMLVQPGPQVILNGYQIIKVDKLPDFQPTLVFHRNFNVREQQVTRITLTIDLDSTLVEGATDYTFNPVYYISSVR